MTQKTQINYTVDRGEMWERLIIPKDRRTRRRRVPVEANASVKVGDTIYVLPCEITSEGGVQLSMTANNTEWLQDGEYDWDMTATISRSALLTSTPLVEMVIVYGKLIVSTYNNLTPMASDGVAVPLEVRE